MSRQKQFDEADILTKAMFTFHDKGYGGTSIKDLEAATGLKPGSLYHAFGSKHGLYLRVMDHYLEKVINDRVDRYLRDGEPITAIREFFTSAVDHAIGQGRVCLLAKAGLEFGTGDGEIAERVTIGLRRIEDGFRDHMIRSRRGGWLSADVEIEPLAASLLANFYGVLVVARIRPDRAILEKLVDSALAPLIKKG